MVIYSPVPEWRVSGDDFWTIFKFSEKHTLHHLTDPVTEQALAIDKVDRLLLLLQDNSLSPKYLREILGLTHRQSFRENYVYPAIEEGLIEMTLPNKPTSPKQTYRLTESGKERVLELLKRS